jgi:hypothetical protein
MGNSMQGSKVYICTTSQSTAPADATAYAALTWVEIKKVGNMGQMGMSQNILTYPTWGDGVADKSKGMADAGSPTLEVMRDTADTGQDGLRTAAATNLKYAFKIERNDKLTGGGTNSIFYNWGVVSGPTRPQGGNEDFDVEVFTLGFSSAEVSVDPT